MRLIKALAVIVPLLVAGLGLVALLLSGFQISGFWTAVGGALIVSLTGWVASGLIGNNGKVEVMTRRL